MSRKAGIVNDTYPNNYSKKFLTFAALYLNCLKFFCLYGLQFHHRIPNFKNPTLDFKINVLNFSKPVSYEEDETFALQLQTPQRAYS